MQGAKQSKGAVRANKRKTSLQLLQLFFSFYSFASIYRSWPKACEQLNAPENWTPLTPHPYVLPPIFAVAGLGQAVLAYIQGTTLGECTSVPHRYAMFMVTGWCLVALTNWAISQQR